MRFVNQARTHGVRFTNSTPFEMPQVHSSRTTSLAMLEQFTADLSWYFSIILLGGDVRFENV
jgi:hypothetical protein